MPDQETDPEIQRILEEANRRYAHVGKRQTIINVPGVGPIAAPAPAKATPVAQPKIAEWPDAPAGAIKWVHCAECSHGFDFGPCWRHSGGQNYRGLRNGKPIWVCAQCGQEPKGCPKCGSMFVLCGPNDSFGMWVD